MRLKKEIYKREINKREINKKEINKKKIYKKNIYKKDEKIIKKIIAVFIFLFSLNLSIKSVGAKTGALGFFGGISQGWRLPKTTETITGSARKKNNEALVYKEIIFLSGEPTEFEGLMTVKNGEATENFGSYDVSFVVRPNGNNDATVDRNITFNVNYRKEGTQTVKDFSASSWSETITIDGENYVLDPAASNFGVSVLEDAAPGVSYYKGAVSMRATYISGEDKTVVEVSGDIYGYDSAWSAVETHILNGAVITPTRRVQYKIRPSVAVFKELQYAENQPAAISFSGNYREVSQNNSRLDYEIYNFKEEPKKGSATIDSYNAFEQLIAPDAEFLRGHFAEEEIAKLFAMQILDGDPKHFIPNQAVTRSQFVTALAKAVKAPIEENVKTRGKKNAAPEIIFPDVTEERPDYKYINAAYKIGLAYGKSEGYFYADAELTREEAVVLATRVLGIKNLDPAPLTAFSDDADISGWGRREIFSATRLGLIPASGRFGPKDPVTKAEAATLIVRLIDYARYEIQKEYSNL